jgi:hypothetical protein
VRGWAAAAAGLLAAAATLGHGAGGELLEIDCAPAEAEAIADPLDRSGLEGMYCALPEAGGVLIVTDENLSWPVLVSPSGRVSFEEALLSDIALVGPGLPQVRLGTDRVLLATDPPARALIEFSSADPATLAPRSRWLAIALDAQEILGAADTPEAAAALR